MRRYPASVINLFAVFVVVSTTFTARVAQSEQSQNNDVLNPSNFDIVGITLGMTVDQAVSELQKFNSKLSVSKNYLVSDNYGDIGQQTAPDDRFRVVKSLIATNEEYTQYEAYRRANNFGYTSTFRSKIPSIDAIKGNPEKIVVMFAPIYKAEHVIAVQRTINYIGMPQISESITSSILGKYPNEMSIKDFSRDSVRMAWLFDGRERFLPQSTAKMRNLSGGDGEMPRSIRSDGGTALSFYLKNKQDNTRVAEYLSMCLYDERRLYKSESDAKQTMRQINEIKNSEENKRLMNSGSITKF